MGNTIMLIGDTHRSFEVIRITGATLPEVRREFPSPRWKIFAEDDPECPRFRADMQKYVHHSDWSNRSQYLQVLVFHERMQREGKHNYSVRGRLRDGSYRNRFVYAKSFLQLFTRYPRLRPYYYQPIIGDPGYSDIDVEDDFLRQFRLFRPRA